MYTISLSHRGGPLQEWDSFPYKKDIVYNSYIKYYLLIGGGDYTPIDFMCCKILVIYTAATQMHTQYLFLF